jgi:hypothetical protein
VSKIIKCAALQEMVDACSVESDDPEYGHGKWFVGGGDDLRAMYDHRQSCIVCQENEKIVSEWRKTYVNDRKGQLHYILTGEMT